MSRESVDAFDAWAKQKGYRPGTWNYIRTAEAWHTATAQAEAGYAPDAAPASPPLPVREGWKLAPLEPTEEMLNIGQHVNSEWLNDEAPIGERRYREPAKCVYQKMLAAAPSIKADTP